MLSFRMRLPAAAAIFTMHYFYGRLYSYINDAVTSLSITSPLHNTHDGVNIGDFISISLDLKTV